MTEHEERLQIEMIQGMERFSIQAAALAEALTQAATVMGPLITAAIEQQHRLNRTLSKWDNDGLPPLNPDPTGVHPPLS